MKTLCTKLNLVILLGKVCNIKPNSEFGGKSYEITT